jgi:nucleoside-diphosphate-sugar epimerase
MSASIAMTGASGFLGAHVHRMLVASGQSVVRLGRRNADVTADLLRHEPAWDRIGGPSTLLHCAGIMAADASSVIDSARMAVNLLSSLPSSIRRLVLVSSAYVYPPSETNVTEDEPAKPSNPYGHAKVMVESLFQGVAQATGRELVILRPCAIYGPGDPNQKAITRFVAAARSGAVPTLKGDITFQRDYIHVKDVARCVGTAINAPLPRAVCIVNVCTGSAWSAVELAALIGELKPDAKWQIEAQEPDVIGYRFDPARAIRELGFKAEIDLRSGVGSLLDGDHDVTTYKESSDA